ncbi:hypothetical protein ACJMK2_018229 [Sinanodonta woodiana]|uniref:Uncharacterized protein n=1 Tax=Sinanodonta woodiana TaxID=1069815 RepID=A0ABD3UCS0_SINWO
MEANALLRQLKMFLEGKLKRRQNRKTKEKQVRFFHLSDMFQNYEISVNALLNKCARVYAAPFY